MAWTLKSVFYYLFFFLAAVFVVNLIFFLTHQRLKKALKNEFFRLKREGRFRLPHQKTVLVSVALGLFFCAAVLSYLLTGHPVFGLLVVFLIPGVLRLLTGVRMVVQRQDFDEAAFSFLVALRGLSRVGMSLPAALFQISKNFPSGFARHLNRHLQRFDEGHTLSETLKRFQKRAGLGYSGLALTLLEMAHSRGLQAGPILDQVVPMLESERQAEKRVQGIRKSVCAQGLIAFSLPWLLGLVLCFFQPEMTERFLHSPILFGVVAVALLFQFTGAFVLWRLSAFY